MASISGRWLRTTAAAALIVSAPFLVAACGFGKVQECNKLIQTANAQQENVKKATDKLKASNSAGDVENMASTFENAAKAIAAVELKDEKLKQLSKDYQDMLNDAAKNCREMAAGMRAKDQAKINKASTGLNQVGPTETKVINNINAYCQGR